MGKYRRLYATMMTRDNQQPATEKQTTHQLLTTIYQKKGSERASDVALDLYVL
jgi:hypothetical protein